MATRKPLVSIGGELQELPVGDTVQVGFPLFIQSTQPTGASYAWFQTNYLVAGGLTLWVEDGLP